MNVWYKNLKKSKFTPPSWVFGVVWPILYTMMFVSLFIVLNTKKCGFNCIFYFATQFILNILWSPLFFNYRMIKLAYIDLFLIIYFTYLTYKEFFKLNVYAGYLLLPYLCWLCYALFLNTYIVLYN